MSQEELARRAGTSRTAISAYERGHKSPSLETFERLLGAAGYAADARPRISFGQGVGRRSFVVPDRLPTLSAEVALAAVVLPLSLNWSQPGRAFRLCDRADRARVYEMVLREGGPDDILRYIDGVLLVDLWDELVLPRDVRAAWEPLIARVLVTGAAA
jgi:transcriptional regulator with XRE-family HTH domain